jgi:GNAT superfamily N-acetyltransferase
VLIKLIRPTWRTLPARLRTGILNFLDWLKITAEKLRLLLQSRKWYRRALRRAIGKQIHYRLANRSDAPEISKLLAYWPSHEKLDSVGMALANIGLEKPSDYIIVATRRNKIIGAAVITRSPEGVISGPEWRIFEIRVLDRYQGAGVGRGLIIKAGYQTLKRGAKSLGGDVLMENSKTIVMCDKFKGTRMTSTDYDPYFDGTLHDELSEHIFFYRSIEDGLATLEREGVLDCYRGTGCLNAD